MLLIDLCVVCFCVIFYSMNQSVILSMKIVMKKTMKKMILKMSI
jgi:hypothetical protein